VERLALSQAQLEAIFENSPYGALLADRSGEIVRSNVRLKALIDANELETFVIRDPRYAQLFDGDRTGFSVEVRSESAGVFRWVACDVSSIALPGNRTTVALAFARDITARREAEMKLRYETNHDSVSRLPNRAYFIERVGREIAEEPGASRAVAFLDLRVEESGAELGYTGDELFAAVSARLASSVEPNDFVARFDGSTFVVLLYGRCDRDSVRPVIEKFMQRLKEPIVMDAREVHVRAWAGVALTDRPYAEVLDILRDAEIAMFEARSGDLDFAVFTPDMRDRAARRLALVSHLRKALERDQLYLVYQPLIDSVSRRVHGFEALLRWEHPELGNIPPMEFIPLAEDVGTIAAIGRFVLERACAQLAIWQTAGLVRPGACSIAVNVSVHELVAADYPAFVTRTLARHAIEPASIVLEITEGAFISGDGDAPAALERLKAIGVSLAIDDFGTGYSSLRYLHDFSFDELKIDASFVRGADGELAARPIVMMLTTLAKSLGVSLVAEGVETRAQADALLELGVDTLQGYYFGRPISAALVPEYLRNHEARVLAERGVKEMGNVTPLKPALPKSSA
jgi:diguanylate cyclase (GGDEF)-like protein